MDHKFAKAVLYRIYGMDHKFGHWIYGMDQKFLPSIIGSMVWIISF